MRKQIFNVGIVIIRCRDASAQATQNLDLSLMTHKKLLYLLFWLLSLTQLHAQEKVYPQGYFRSPVDIPIRLAGNFGEIRGNHFHAGLDIKTNQVEGLNIYASASGYVSRIKISLYGYGKVLYVTHPNGFTTAYAHLQQFNDTLEAYVRKHQYLRESFEIELFPAPGELPVEKGEVIALSGNTGGSGGPHLHFEIRETATSIPINPLKFGFAIQDNIKPILKTLSFYPLNDTSIVNGENTPLHLTLRGSNGNYSIPGPMNLSARGVIGVGIEAIDRFNGSSNRCGVYSIRLDVDGETHYEHEMERIPFELSRYINSHVDYYETKKNRRRVQKSYLDPNNKLNIYKNVKLSGKLFFSTFGHDVHYTVKDFYGNTSAVHASIAADTTTVIHPKARKGLFFAYNAPNSYKTDSFKLFLPAGSLYKNTYFNYKRTKQTFPFLTSIHHAHNLYVPLHSYATMQINIATVPDSLRSKLYAVSLKENLSVLSPEGGSVEGSWLIFKSRSFGPYSVLADTQVPSVWLKKGISGKADAGSSIVFSIKDNESGIANYRGEINGEWVLMEYDRKTKELTYTVDGSDLNEGVNELKVTITDAVGNTQMRKTSFIW